MKQRSTRAVTAVLAAAAFAAAPSASRSQTDPGTPQPTQQTYPDGDPAAVRSQADMSAKGLSDRQVTVRVREVIIENQSAASSFRNVKVKTHKGKVTLKGRVRTQADKDEAAAKAASVVGSDNVNNEITISQ